MIPDGDQRIPPKLAFEILESKFHPPTARPGIVTRAALVNRLAAARAPIITVVAPPGYGKTTLLAQWAKRIGPSVAWVSCSGEDNDPVVLLGALAVALDRIEPVDPAIFQALPSPGADVIVVPRFVSAISSMHRPVTVVLDHVEAVTNKQCLNVIAEFALRLPPGSQLALASRTGVPLPVARLRAQGGIVEIGVEDLAMGPQEAASLLEGAGAELGKAGLGELLRRTEGWPVGLYIAALAMKSGSRQSEVGFTFTGDDVSWVTICALSSSTGFRARKRHSSPEPRSWAGCADRSVTRSWARRDRSASLNGWRAGTCWWSRSTAAVNGIATTTCCKSCCRPNSGGESPIWCRISISRRLCGTRRTQCRRLRSGMPKRRETTTGWRAWSWNSHSPSGPAGGSRQCCAGWSGSGT